MKKGIYICITVFLIFVVMQFFKGYKIFSVSAHEKSNHSINEICKELHSTALEEYYDYRHQYYFHSHFVEHDIYHKEGCRKYSHHFE